MQIEEELNKLPFTITMPVEVECSECHQLHKKRLTYNLQMSLQAHEGCFRFFLFYICYDNAQAKTIGRCVGTGYKTIKEAIEELKKEIYDGKY